MSDVWIKRSKNSDEISQISFQDSCGEWKIFFCPIKDLVKFINKNYDMAKFKNIEDIKKGDAEK
jgi:hypothetical protein